jgi:hypothetical protein
VTVIESWITIGSAVGATFLVYALVARLIP